MTSEKSETLVPNDVALVRPVNARLEQREGVVTYALSTAHELIVVLERAIELDTPCEIIAEEARP